MNKKMDPPHLVLSSQELACWQYANAGKTIAEIAGTLNLTIRTVKFCLLNAEKKVEWVNGYEKIAN